MDKHCNTTKRWWGLIASAVLAVFVWLLWWPDPSQGPVVDGKRLSVWLEIFATSYYHPSRAIDDLPRYAGLFRKAGPPGIVFLEHKLTEKSELETKYVRLKSKSPGWLFKVLPTVRLDDWRQKECAALILGEIGPPASNAVPALVGQLNFTEVRETDKSKGESNGTSYSPLARAHAIRALARIAPDSPVVVAALIDALKQKYVWVPKSISSPSSFGKSSVADYAADALAGLGPEYKDKIPGMIANLKYQDQMQFRGAGMTNVYPVGSSAPGDGESVPRLVTELKNSDPEVRDAAAYDLGAIRQDKEKAEAALPAVTEALNDDDAFVRMRSAETILTIDPIRFKLVLPTLINSLNETNYVIRLRAIELIRQIGPDAKNAMSSLTNSLHDESATVRTWAREALIQVGLKAGVKSGIK